MLTKGVMAMIEEVTEGPTPSSSIEDGFEEKAAREWAMILHFSMLAGYLVPIAGFIAPLVIWQIKKEELPSLDEHGKLVANWLISSVIYGVVGFFLLFLIIGIPILAALGICNIVFPLIGGLKANQGEVWRYPLTIQFIS
jgi:hypothetical protein